MGESRGLAVALLAGLGIGLSSTAPALAASSLPVPTDLASASRDLETGLRAVGEAGSIDEARRVHETRVEPPATNLTPLAGDLAGRQGELLVSLIDQLDAQLARGNLSDARSLAGAAANSVRDHLEPAASRWEVNRTALSLGPVRWQEGQPVVALVLVNPPPGGIGAFDATIRFDSPATPTSAQLSLGQGQTQVDPANRSVRAASFDARSLARLDGPQRSATALADIRLDLDGLDPGRPLTANVSITEVADSEGNQAPAIGLASSSQIPPPDTGLPVDSRWLVLGGVGLAAVGLVAAARRLEL